MAVFMPKCYTQVMCLFEDTLFLLIRSALGKEHNFSLPKVVDWQNVMELSVSQGVAAIAVDGLQKLYEAKSTSEPLLDLDKLELTDLKYQWLGQSLRCEQLYHRQLQAIRFLTDLWKGNGLKPYALKGVSFAQYYPIPGHRISCDFDCYVKYMDESLVGDGLAWKLADKLVAESGVCVDASESKHSRYVVQGVPVENHLTLIGVNGSQQRKHMNAYLQSLLKSEDSCAISVESVMCPCWLFNALFCVEHARHHFLVEEGITLKHILDWVQIRKDAQASKYLPRFKSDIERFGLRPFYEAFDAVADYVMGIRSSLSSSEQMFLADVLAPKKILPHKSKFQARLNILRMVWHNRWKFRLYSETTAVSTTLRYIYGHFFDRYVNPVV